MVRALSSGECKCVESVRTFYSSRKSWQNAVGQDALPWIQLSGLGSGCVDVAKLYGVSAIPSNFLMDPEGKILAVDLRGEKLEKVLEQVFEPR